MKCRRCTRGEGKMDMKEKRKRALVCVVLELSWSLVDWLGFGLVCEFVFTG